jgi:hypothetical protein
MKLSALFRLALLLGVVSSALAMAAACSSSASIPLQGATDFSPPAGWRYGATCTGNVYVIDTTGSCVAGQQRYILCVDGVWADSWCDSTVPSGYTKYTGPLFGGDGGKSDATTPRDAGREASMSHDGGHHDASSGHEASTGHDAGREASSATDTGSETTTHTDGGHEADARADGSQREASADAPSSDARHDGGDGGA